ncbi:Ankyrin repeat-containing protein 41 [Elsinoe fawcettii]|nr:Ankyrin repeat-containing protein 41 [Elsinoe fawcettii]
MAPHTAAPSGTRLLHLLSSLPPNPTPSSLSPILTLLSTRPSLTARDAEGNTAVHIATYASCPATIFTALAHAGADLNARNHAGDTALHFACGETLDFLEGEKARKLLQAGAGVDVRTHRGEDLMLAAARSVGRRDVRGHLGSVIRLGGRVDSRDYQGRGVWHFLFRQEGVSSGDWMGWLVEQGADPKMVDYEGNGILHELFMTGRMEGMVRRVKDAEELGVNLEGMNNSGRTPLHLLCGRGYVDDSGVGLRGCLRCMLGKVIGIDARDNDGVTPLHLAALVSECAVGELLNAGADPTLTTEDGLNVLHLAARGGQSNIIGSVIEHVRKKRRRLLPVLVHAQDNRHWTPLHYACLSGRVESVQMLLDAGTEVIMEAKQCLRCPPADPVDVPNPLQACQGFETEQALWSGYRTLETKYDPMMNGYGHESDTRFTAFGTTLESEERPFVKMAMGYDKSKSWQNRPPPWHEQQSARLDEILHILIKRMCETEKGQYAAQDDIDSAIDHARKWNHLYVLRCFLHVRGIYFPETYIRWGPNPRSPDYSKPALADVLATASSDAYSTAIAEANSNESARVFQLAFQLLSNRQYTLFTDLVKKCPRVFENSTSGRQQNEADLNFLARYGFSDLLEQASTIVSEYTLERQTWHSLMVETLPDYEDHSLGFDYPSRINLLWNACLRSLPNMDTIRVCVEDLKVDVDIRSEGQRDTLNGYRFLGGNTALHYLARGEHWWHVTQAMPYLLASDADVHIRNEQEQTALWIAVESNGLYSLEAMKLLLDAGADPDTSDGDYKGVLRIAAQSKDKFDLLLSYGAKIGPEILAAAIEAGQVENVRTLLARGLEPNLVLSDCDAKPAQRTSQAPGKGWLLPRWGTTLAGTALQIASESAIKWAGTGYEHKKHDYVESCEQIIHLLLACGADPFAAISQDALEPSPEGKQLEWILTGATPNDSTAPAIAPEARSSEDDVLSFSSRCSTPDASSTSEASRPMTFTLHALLESCPSSVGVILTSPSLRDLDISRRNASGVTSLLAACRSSAGADLPMHSSRLGLTYRISGSSGTDGDKSAAVETGTAVQHLLSRGADPLARDEQGRNALHNLLLAWGTDENGNLPRVRNTVLHLANKYPVLVGQKDDFGRTPLHLAVLRFVRAQALARGNFSYNEESKAAYEQREDEAERIITDLLELGADAKAVDQEGNSVLHYLACGGLTGHLSMIEGEARRRRVFEVMLAKGLDIDARNKHGHNVGSLVLLDRTGEKDEETFYGGYNKEQVRASDVAGLVWLYKKGVRWSKTDAQERSTLDLATINVTKRAGWRLEWLLRERVRIDYLDVEKMCAKLGEHEEVREAKK